MDLNDGLIPVTIAGREPFDLDIYTAKLAIEEFELKYEKQRYQDAETKEWLWKMTAAMSLDLQKAFTDIGVPVMSGSLAMSLWLKVNETWEEVKKNMPFIQTSPTNTDAALPD